MSKRTQVATAVTVFVLSALLATQLEPLHTVDVSPVINDGFEGGGGGECLYWEYTRSGAGEWLGPYTGCGNEQRSVPAGWTGWWVNHRPCTLSPSWESGIPEYRLSTSIVAEGKHSSQLFTTWKCLYGGLFQAFLAEPGQVYQVAAAVRVSHTSCSARRHEPPLGSDCLTPIPGATATVRLGIGPLGGKDPWDPNVIWGAPVESYGSFAYATTPPTVVWVATPTLWVEAETGWPLKHNDAWIDDVSVWVAHTVYLPVVLK